jgi:hypothetical protein
MNKQKVIEAVFGLTEAGVLSSKQALTLMWEHGHRTGREECEKTHANASVYLQQIASTASAPVPGTQYR